MVGVADYPVAPARHGWGLILAGVATAIIMIGVGRLWFMARRSGAGWLQAFHRAR
jgi:hypothetical protein